MARLMRPAARFLRIRFSMRPPALTPAGAIDRVRSSRRGWSATAMPVERRVNLTIDCWDFAQGKACRGAIRRWTFGHHRCRKRHLPSGHEHGAWRSFAANSNAGGPAVRFLKNWHSPCPSLARQVWTSSEAIAEERASPLSWGLLPRPARDCPEDQFRAIGVPREAT